jgi:hypothetical protein
MLRGMDEAPFVYLDVDEYERIRNTSNKPESVCLEVHGYWVQKIPAIVYELEYRGLLTDDEKMSVYIIWSLTSNNDGGKLIA